MARRTDEFQTIRSEGGLLPPDLLRRVLDPKATLAGTRPEDYGLPQGERLNEIITQSWNRLRKHWTEFRAAAGILPQGEAGTGLTNDKWSLPLLRELGFGLLPTSAGPEIDGRTYAISRFFGPVPIHLVGCGLSLDRRAAGQRGAAAANPHGLVQEFVNRSPGYLWAIVSNGLRLRVLRDSQAMSRQSFLEFDLEAIFLGEVYSDFVLLWLMVHATRFAPRESERPETCWLEQWTKEAEEQGTRALEGLRGGVEKALQILGEGFTSHPKNIVLRDALRTGKVPPVDFHGQLLRVVYRLIFLFVAEDRTLDGQPLLHPRDESHAGKIARERYAIHYSTRRLRELASEIKGSRHTDLWRQFQVLVHALSGDEAAATAREHLALPTLGSLLWDRSSTASLNDALLTNYDFLEALRHLAFTRQAKVLRPVDYKNLGAEELGGVYESLLALTPQISADGARFAFAEFAGNERKTSGSYYTPDSLVQCLLDSALDPVVDQAIKGKTSIEAEKAILALRVCDPAVGSGHFLVGAAHRLARHLSRIRAVAHGENEPSPFLYQHALRDVIGRCLYGVDVNPMAAELCRVSLWLEALEPGKPLSFLDHHIRVGNSLLGLTPELIAAGLPDEAFSVADGDDKKACAALRKRNRRERRGLGPLFSEHEAEAEARLQQAAAALEELSDDRPEGVRAKELAFRLHEQTEEYQRKKGFADTWCAAFVINKTFGTPGLELSATGITQRNLNALADGAPLGAELEAAVTCATAEYRFFHWHLAFPEVYAKGGFDCLLGNPPWVRQEFLGRIKNLLTLFSSYSGTADLSVFFVSLALRLLKPGGRAGLLTPNKWLQASYGSGLRDEVLRVARPVLLVDFGHSRNLFPDADTFPAAFVFERGPDQEATLRFVRAHDDDRARHTLRALIDESWIGVPVSDLTTERWQLEDAKVSGLIANLRSRGTPLGDLVDGQIFRGVLTGLNEGFIISRIVRDRLIAESPEAGEIIKPWLTGADVKRWRVEWSGSYLIFTRHGIDITKYPSIEHHLSRFRMQLEPKASAYSEGPGRKPGNYRWYEIQDNVAFSDLLDHPKIVVPCIAYYCEFALEAEGAWPNNKVIFIDSDDLFLLAVLNSRVMWWLMSRLMIKMKDDALSVDVHVLAKLPIPHVTENVKDQMKRLVTDIRESLTNGDLPKLLDHESRLNQFVEDAFGLTAAERQTMSESLPTRDPLVTLAKSLSAQSAV
jgi:hypothetical protein